MTPLLTALIAFGAGIASFLSPCVLPLVPAYIGHLAGTSVSEERDTEATLRTVAHAAFFVLGFSTVFVILWASIGLVGWAIQGYTFYLRYIGGAILVILGLHVAGVFRIRWLN
ncbi:MAG: cytochrome c biogenesis protein CcdA, partial [Chloroflexota bacterium]|nr:cytochrome c biogenesis protein CcdA [Chloroflexota bacterium]